jgi:hypothetical protein
MNADKKFLHGNILIRSMDTTLDFPMLQINIVAVDTPVIGLISSDPITGLTYNE